MSLKKILNSDFFCMATWVDKIKWFVILVLVQGIVIGQIQATRYALPLLYILFLLKLPSDTGRKSLLAYAFLIGMCVDVFSNTLGLNITASLWLAMARPLLLRWQTPRDAAESFIPGIKSMRFWPYLRYVLPSVLLHSFVFNLVDTFSFIKIQQISLNSLADATSTIVLIFIIEFVRRNK